MYDEHLEPVSGILRLDELDPSMLKSQIQSLVAHVANAVQSYFLGTFGE